MSASDSAPTDEVELGSIVGVFGVRGEVRVHLHNRESYLMAGRAQVCLVSPDGARRTSRIRCRPGAGKRVLARVDGPRNREDAHAMIGTRIVVERAALPSLEDDEFYVYQLVGLSVRCDDRVVGSVIEVHNTAGGDILEIDLDDGPVYVALAAATVPVVDVDGGFCEVTRAALEDL